MAKQYYSLEVRTIVAGFPMANVFTLFIDDPSVANEFLVAQSIINALPVGAGLTSWLSRFQALLSEDVYISNILCRRMTDGGGNTAETILQEDSKPGLQTGDVAASQVAACVIWVNTDFPDKTGRNFIPGVSLSCIEGGRWEAAFQTAVDNFIARTLSGFAVSAGTALFCTWDREAEVGYQLTNGYLSPKVGTQRRRERPL